VSWRGEGIEDNSYLYGWVVSLPGSSLDVLHGSLYTHHLLLGLRERGHDP
jgi:hypothetical protein